MSTLVEKAAAGVAKMAQQNPSVTAADVQPAPRRRIPMTVPTRKLEVPPIPGYYLYWHNGSPSDLQKALDAGFEFVNESEVKPNNRALGGDATKSGSTDLGTRVSIVAGDETGSDGQPVRLYLMKQKLEYYEEDQAILRQRNAAVAEALTSAFHKGVVGGKESGEANDDTQKRYVKQAKLPDFFKPKPHRR